MHEIRFLQDHIFRSDPCPVFFLDVLFKIDRISTALSKYIKTLEDVKKVPVMYLKIQPPMRKRKREKIPDL